MSNKSFAVRAVAFGGLGGLCVAGFIVLLYTIVTKMIFTGDRVVTVILLSLFLIFAALSRAYVIWQESLKDKKSRVATAPGRGLDSAQSVIQLADGSSFTRVPSAVEGTTELLDAKRKTTELK